MRRQQTGSALFMILMAVALFAALAFTFSRGLQQGSQSLSDRQAELAATDIIAFASRVERVTSRILQNHSETLLSFDGINGTYSTPACTADDCKVFAAEGGGLAPVYPMVEWLSPASSGEIFYRTWFFTARFCVPQVGTDACAGSSGTDLVMMLPYIRKTLCEKINQKIGIPLPTPAPSTVGSIDPTGKFNGSFAPASPVLWDDTDLNGRSSGCVQDGTDTYHFYQVLVAR